MSEGLTHRGSGWIYEGVWAVLTDLFRVPRDPPRLPAPPAAAKTLRPCDGWLRYRRMVFWIILFVFDVALVAGWIALFAEHPGVALWLLPPWLALMIVPDVVAYVAIHLRYDTTWYVISDRSMRIRRGVWTVHETTITFDNVQNVKITQGPLQRHCGFSDLVVETAGGGGSVRPPPELSAKAHVGLIEGVEDAAAIRELIMERVRASRSAGLGDERGPVERPARRGWTEAHLAALREIADHAAALRG